MAQFAVLFGSLTAAVLVAAGTMGGFAGVLREADAVGILRPFHPFDARAFSLDPRVRITLWSALIGTLVAFLTRYGADQMVVQRYFVARSLADARRGFLLNIACAVFALLCLAFLGLAVRAALAASPTGGFDALKPVQVLSRFTASMPYGSLLVAGLLASTMSSIDSGLHSCCTAFVIDFLLPSSTPPPAATIGRASPVAAARWLTLALGAAVTVVACFIGNLGSIFEIANKVINGLGSPLLVLVLLGIYGRRVTARGMFAGGIAGTLLSIVLTVCVRRLALHYYAVVNFIGTAALCYAFSLFLPPPARKETPTCPT
jgi:Na+/proline symporter